MTPDPRALARQTGRVCGSCGKALRVPVVVEVRHRKTGERRALALCASCADAPMATWRLAWTEDR
jgi:RNase P subunit RPR2